MDGFALSGHLALDDGRDPGVADHRLDHRVAADIRDLAHPALEPARAERDEFRPDADLGAAPAPGRPALRAAHALPLNKAPPSPELAGQDVHARRADEMADEGMCRALEQFDRRADLHDIAVLHHHHLIGEGQRLGLVMGDIDHRRAHPLVQLLQLGAQLPFQMRVDHGQRFVEHHHVDVLAHQTAAHRDLLLVVRRQVRRRGCSSMSVSFQHLGDLVDPRLRPRPRRRRGCAAERPGCRRRVIVS